MTSRPGRTNRDDYFEFEDHLSKFHQVTAKCSVVAGHCDVVYQRIDVGVRDVVEVVIEVTVMVVICEIK